MSGEQSLTDIENMLRNAPTIGGASVDASEAAGQHLSLRFGVGEVGLRRGRVCA